MLLFYLFNWQAKILDHDNVNYLKKILGELAMVLDQVEAELEKRKLEYQGMSKWWISKHNPDIFYSDVIAFFASQAKSVSCGFVDLNLH